MSISKRQMMRIATDIHQLLQKRQQSKRQKVRNQISEILEYLGKLEAVKRKLNLCEIHDWHGAAKKVLIGTKTYFQDIPFNFRQLEQVSKVYNANTYSASDIYRELIQTQDEFGELNYYKESDLLAVTTEPIELEYVYLGEFEIQLHLPSLAEMQYNNIYRIFAVDPHPAGGNCSVTHPHVSDERLCAGDAGAAINMTLKTGRICDFFLLVRSVLSNYNSDSPFVSLENWSGSACYDCGSIVNGDNVFWCERCENDFCSDCSSYCRICDDSACLGCLTECRICSELICSHCLTTCPECGEELCKNCFENMECQCTEDNQENENEESEIINQENESIEAKPEKGLFYNLDESTETTNSTVSIDAA